MSARDSHDEDVAVGTIYDRRLFGRLLLFARPHRGALLGSVGLLVGGLALKLVGPKIVQLVLDGPVAEAWSRRGEPGFDPRALLDQVSDFALLFLGVAALNAALLLAREWLMNRTGQRIVLELRNRLFQHLLRLPVSWFDRRAVGWTVTRSTSDVDALSELFTTGVATLAYDVLSIVVFMTVLAVISPELALVALLLLPVMMLVSFRFRLNARVAYRATRASLSRMNAFLQERLAGLSVVRLFRREAAASRRFDELNTRYYSDNMLTVRHFALFFPTVDTLAMVIRLGCLVWGTWLIAEDRLTLGVFVQFWFYLDFIFEPIRELAERYNILQAAMAAAERVFGILDTRTEDGPPLAAVAGAAALAMPIAPPPGGVPAALEFRHVSFAYPDGAPVLHDVSFVVRPGERVAVVGHTGAGKSTLVNLLCRFHETPQGQVLVHGRDVCTIPHRELRRRIAIVQQDVFLFSDTLAANIRMGNAELPDERVTAAATAVHAHDFIARLPAGYATVLTERGGNLSSGQRQLVAFARALAADPDILVLDEATSSVDSETEALIEDATTTLLTGRTSLVIAHRLSTVVSADRIVVMHKGRVHEEGSHDELMARRGLYWKLYRLHLAGAPD